MSGFPLVRLGDVVSIDRDQRQWSERRYVGLEDIESNSGRLLGDGSNEKVKSSTFGFDDRHVLYGRLRPYLNKVLLPEFEGHCSTEIFPILVSANVNRRYLWYWLTSESTVEAIDATCTGARMPRANMERVLDLILPLPPLEEQRQIVSVLDKAFAAIATATANTEKNLANARDLLTAEISNVFSMRLGGDWKSTTVEAIAASHKGSMRTGPFGSQLLHSEFVDDGVVVLGIDNAVQNTFQWGKRRFITDEKFEELSRFLVHPGDVIITIMGTCGRCAIVPDDIPTAINSKHLFCITLDKLQCLPEYLHAYFLHAPDARAYLEGRAQGSIMAGLNMGIIREMPVRVPPLDRQRELVDAIRQAEDLSREIAVVYECKLVAYSTLKQSLLRRAFSAGQERESLEVANDNFNTPEFTANVIAFAYWVHRKQNRDKSYKHVKAQKCLHNVESIAGIDLGRHPMKYQNGPHDPVHMRRAEEWAKTAGFFEFVPSTTGPGYDFKKLSNYDALWLKAQAAIEPMAARVERSIAPLVTMNMEEAELFTTVHAAWNNLIIDDTPITEEAILREARYNWDPAKLAIPESKFRNAIKEITAKQMIPNGSAKYVGGQESLLF